jgi:hypothetical protein
MATPRARAHLGLGCLLGQRGRHGRRIGVRLTKPACTQLSTRPTRRAARAHVEHEEPQQFERQRSLVACRRRTRVSPAQPARWAQRTDERAAVLAAHERVQLLQHAQPRGLGLTVRSAAVGTLVVAAIFGGVIGSLWGALGPHA